MRDYHWEPPGVGVCANSVISCEVGRIPLRISPQNYKTGFPGGSVVKNLPASVRDTGSIPDSGRSCITQNQACVPQLLSLCSRVWEPQLLSPCPAPMYRSPCTPEALTSQSQCSATRKATAIRSPSITIRENPHSNEHPTQSEKKKNPSRQFVSAH